MDIPTASYLNNLYAIPFWVLFHYTKIFCFIILGLTMHATILAYMFSLLEMGKITVPLSPSVAVENNIVFTQEFLLNLLKAAFPHLNK